MIHRLVFLEIIKKNQIKKNVQIKRKEHPGRELLPHRGWGWRWRGGGTIGTNRIGYNRILLFSHIIILFINVLYIHSYIYIYSYIDFSWFQLICFTIVY